MQLRRFSISNLSIKHRLPLLIGELLLAIVLASTLASYRGVKESALEVGGERLQNLTKQLVSMASLKKNVQALRVSEQRLQMVIENLSEGLVVSDLNGQLLNWNRAALELHGFASLDECLLKLPEFAKIFELSDLAGCVLDLEQWPLPRIIRGERLRNFEVRIRRLDSDWNRVFNYGGSIVQVGSFWAVINQPPPSRAASKTTGKSEPRCLTN
ncbi:MAG TPA: PAS domain-containing protein [Pyrinomonadaceae bacterium]|nr:PAS domain-containing protein [Pyrinomonadaceae bacterium]